MIEIDDDKLTFNYYYGKHQDLPWDSISDLSVALTPPASSWTLGGAIRFKGRFRGFGLSYEVAKAIEQKYIEKYNRNPPHL